MWAHFRIPTDVMRSGWAMTFRHASHAAFTIAS